MIIEELIDELKPVVVKSEITLPHPKLKWHQKSPIWIDGCSYRVLLSVCKICRNLGTWPLREVYMAKTTTIREI
jgi:hypothetical protein